MFYVAQILGLIAVIILSLSFQNNKKETLLKYQVFSSLFFALQYLCLNALTGFFMNLATMLRNIIFKKYENKVPLKYIIITILAMIILSVFSYDGIISLLPTIAVINYSIAVSQKNLTITRIAEVISCILFIIYNIKVLAIIGLIATIIEMIFVLIAIYRFDIRKKNG